MHGNNLELEPLKESFFLENETLIDQIKEYEDIHSHLKGIFQFYKENQNLFFQYTQLQLGLARFLDFNLNATPFIDQLNLISTLAWKIIQNSCGQHEDGACVIESIAYTRVSSNIKHPVWPELPLAHALSFNSPVKPVTLSKDTIIYRIIGKNGHQEGHWWLESKPNSRRQWRSDFAVLTAWNQGTQCVFATVNEELNVWRGETASQAVYPSDTNCYLKGSGIQIWLDPTDRKLGINDMKPWS